METLHTNTTQPENQGRLISCLSLYQYNYTPAFQKAMVTIKALFCEQNNMTNLEAEELLLAEASVDDFQSDVFKNDAQASIKTLQAELAKKLGFAGIQNPKINALI